MFVAGCMTRVIDVCCRVYDKSDLMFVAGCMTRVIDVCCRVYDKSD